MKNHTKINYIEPKYLQDHPLNKQYHKDLAGENWEILLQSLDTDGMIHPVIVSEIGRTQPQYYTIISGHQRVRATRELKWQEVPCIIEAYNSPEEQERALIAANRAQREYHYKDRLLIGARLLELYEDKRKERTRNEKGHYNHSVQVAQNKTSPRDLASQEAGLHTQDIAIINKIKTLSPEKQAEMWAYIDSKNPNRTQLRQQVQQLTGEIRKLKKKAGKINNINAKEAKLKKQQTQIRNTLNQHPEYVHLEKIINAFNRCQNFMIQELSVITELPLPAGAEQTEQVRMYASMLKTMLDNYGTKLEQRYIKIMEEEEWNSHLIKD